MSGDFEPVITANLQRCAPYCIACDTRPQMTATPLGWRCEDTLRVPGCGNVLPLDEDVARAAA